MRVGCEVHELHEHLQIIVIDHKTKKLMLTSLCTRVSYILNSRKSPKRNFPTYWGVYPADLPLPKEYKYYTGRGVGGVEWGEPGIKTVSFSPLPIYSNHPQLKWEAVL